MHRRYLVYKQRLAESDIMEILNEPGTLRASYGFCINRHKSLIP